MDKKLYEQLQELVKNDPNAREKLQELVQDQEIKGVGNKLRHLVKGSGHKMIEMQEPLQVSSPAAVNKKFTCNRFTFQEVIRLVAYLGGSITVKVGDEIVEFTEEDL